MRNNWDRRYLTNEGINSELAKKDSETISKLDASPISFCPGATIETPGGGRVDADVAGWNWLLPLLEQCVANSKD